MTREYHAEYKIPGGKLLVLDGRLEAGVLRGVQFSGDFFLEPPEALEALNAAFEGLPVVQALEEAEARAADVLAVPTQAYGLNEAGVAEVLRRALS